MSHARLRKKLHTRLRQLAISPRLAADLEKHAADCNALLPSRRATPAHFGGEPRATRDFVWPKSEAGHLNFIGQLPVSYLGLPDGEILYLFVEALDSAAEPVIVKGVMHGAGKLADIETPDGLCNNEELFDLERVYVSLEPALSLPLGVRSFERRLKDEGEAADALPELEWELRPDGAIGQLFGWARSHDSGDDLYRKAHLASIGEIDRIYQDYWDTKEEFEVAAKGNPYYQKMRSGVSWLLKNQKSIVAGAAAWRMLLRLDSNSKMNLSINDADPLFVFARGKKWQELIGLVLQG